MSFQSDKTGKYLRSQTMAAGAEERWRALRCLSHSYGVGSEGALASLLLATLGGSTTMGDNVSTEDSKPWLRNTLSSGHVRQVAEPFQASANDLIHEAKKVRGAY